MTSIARDIKALIVEKLDSATPQEFAQIVGTLCAPQAETLITTIKVHAVPSAQFDPDFVRIGTNGQAIEREDEPHVAVYDARTGLTWSRDGITKKPVNHEAAVAACRDFKLFGKSDWRLPTIRELLTLVDYERSEPAIDTKFFDCESAYYWTSTPVASNPADAAWIVSFASGYAYWSGRSYVFHVRAVRSGQ